MKHTIYTPEHPQYIKLAAVLSEHGLMGAKEDTMIQAILNALNMKKTITGNDHITHGADTLGDERD
ncbi:MAG TPA: hypothetical protein EYF95_00140 [Flavobacteriales bacterium]|nr:hypothetical protein [Flavobacteriales bacterium]